MHAHELFQQACQQLLRFGVSLMFVAGSPTSLEDTCDLMLVGSASQSNLYTGLGAGLSGVLDCGAWAGGTGPQQAVDGRGVWEAGAHGHAICHRQPDQQPRHVLQARVRRVQ